VTLGFKNQGDYIYLIGGGEPTLGGSEYLAVIHGQEVGRPPALDMEAEKKLQAFLREAISQGLLQSSHDVSDGGLAVTLAECCIAGGIGAHADWNRFSALELFGERTATIVVSASAGQQEPLKTLLNQHGIAFSYFGEVITLQDGNWLSISPDAGNDLELLVSDLCAAYEGAIPAAMASGAETA